MSRSPLRILFASSHCLTDFSSGAAIATLDALRFLALADFRCRAYCASKLDGGRWEEVRDQRSEDTGQRLMVSGDRSVELVHFRSGGVPVQVYETQSARIDEWAAGEPEEMVAAFERVLDDFRPDVLLTYGGDPVTKQMRCRVARGEWRARRRIPVVFWLHNFAYDDARFFEDVDHVIVPSEFSRRWYRERLGLECRVLPYVVDPERVSGEWLVVSGAKDAQRSTLYDQRQLSNAQRSTLNDQRFVTFVNPQPTKGLFLFARIAEQLQRRRPEIPILVVESRGQARGAARDSEW